MKKITALMLSLSMMGFANSTLALTEFEAEELADLTAVFVYLKNDCGYSELPNSQVRKAIIYFAQQNRWDLRNYNSFDMKTLGEGSYRDLSSIAIPTPNKCQSLARSSLSLLAYVN